MRNYKMLLCAIAIYMLNRVRENQIAEISFYCIGQGSKSVLKVVNCALHYNCGKDNRYVIGNTHEKVNTAIRCIATSNFPRKQAMSCRAKSNIFRIRCRTGSRALAYIAPHGARSTALENPIFMGRDEPLSNIVVTRGNVRRGSPFRHLR